MSQLSASVMKKIDLELEKYPLDQKRSAVMAALQFVQAEKGWLSDNSISLVANI